MNWKIVLIILLHFNLSAQKHDYVWVFGNYSGNPPEAEFGASTVDFGATPLKIFRKDFLDERNNLGETCVSFSDRYGNLKLITNGLTIMDSSLNVLPGGEKLEVGGLVGYDGNATRQSAIILEWPDDSTKSAIIYSDSNYSPLDSGLANSTALFYALVDHKLNQGKGAVVLKDQVIVKRKMCPGGISACRHANGRDWWILKHGLAGNKISKVLLQPSGFTDYGVQKLEYDSITYAGSALQTCFSPDGKIFASITLVTAGPVVVNRLLVADFDRCTGSLSTREYFPVHINKNFPVFACGIAISSDSKYMYVPYDTHVYQYDLTSNNIAKSKDTVAIWDGVSDPFPTTFYTAQLAPDGKIYFAAGNGMRHMHVIEFPNKKGNDCHVIQRGLSLPTQKAFSMQNHPNYRLGPLKGSPCDTITVATRDLSTEDYGLKIFPNPASENIQIDITLPNYDPATKTEVILVDVSGEIVQRYTMPDFAYFATMEISKLAGGVYGVQLRQRNKVLAVEKLVVVR